MHSSAAAYEAGNLSSLRLKRTLGHAKVIEIINRLIEINNARWPCVNGVYYKEEKCVLITVHLQIDKEFQEI